MVKELLVKGDIFFSKKAPYGGNLWVVVEENKQLLAKDILDTGLTYSLDAMFFDEIRKIGNTYDKW